MNHVTHPLCSADISIFLMEISKLSAYTDVDRILIHNLQFF